MNPLPQIGPYELFAELGRGGSSRVFRARHRASGRTVALKILDAGADAEALARFEREVQLLARAGSEGLVPVHDSGRDPVSGRVYYAMELMPGGSLQQRLRQRGPLPWREAAAIAAQLARTLERCHQLGVVHRDVKPGNVLFDERDHPRLADFGCARDLVAEALTQSGTSLGTPAYMAPEQLEAKRVDSRADVFSLGVVLFELVSGARPFAGASWQELLHSVQSGVPTTLAQDGVTPRELDLIVARALRPRLETRTASAKLMADELEALLRRSGSGRLEQLFRTSSPSAVSSGIRPSRLPVLALALVAVAMPAVVVALYQSRAQALAPVVTLDEPAVESHAREGEPVRVRGKIQGRASRLEVNGALVAVSDGGFNTSVTLTAASPDIVVVALGAGGARCELRRSLVLEKRAELPTWWSQLREVSKPKVPLPRGLAFGDKPGEYVNARDGSILVFVPGGVFSMGNEHGDANEQPVHEVELSPYFLGKLELTNAQFASFVHATGYLTAAEFLGSNVFDGAKGDFEFVRSANWHHPYGDEHSAAPEEPVVHVSWSDAWAYVTWAGLALPSEAQWERAAVWDVESRLATRYPWGDEDPGTRPVGNLADLSLKGISPRFPVFEGYDDHYPRLAPVGRFPEGRSPVGCEDMIGNVSEWCLDGYDAEFYGHSPRKDPVCPPAGLDRRAGRGASWCAQPSRVRVSSRLVVDAWWTSDFRGIRVARAASDEEK